MLRMSACGEWVGDSWHEALLYAVFLVLTELRQQVSPSSKDQMASYTALKMPCSSWPQKIQVTRPMELSRRQTCCFYLHLGLANCLNFLYHLSILPSMYFQLHVRAWKIGSFWEPIILFASVSKNMSSLSCAALKTAVRSS